MSNLNMMPNLKKKVNPCHTLAAMDTQLVERFIEGLGGTGAWDPSYTKVPFYNGLTGKPYKGANVLRLAFFSSVTDRSAAAFLTFKQAQELGGHVKRGAKGMRLMFYKPIVKTQETELDDGSVSVDEVQTYPAINFFTVFSVADCEVDAAKIAPIEGFKPMSAGLDQSLGASFVLALLKYAGARVMVTRLGRYSLSPDCITLPDLSTIKAEDLPGWISYALLALSTWAAVHVPKLRHKALYDKYRAELDPWACEALISDLAASFACARLGTPYMQTLMPDECAAWTAALKAKPEILRKAADAAGQVAEWIVQCAAACLSAIDYKAA